MVSGRTMIGTLGFLWTPMCLLWSFQIPFGPSRYWIESSICDNLQHQKRCLEVLIFLEYTVPSSFLQIHPCCCTAVSSSEFSAWPSGASNMTSTQLSSNDKWHIQRSSALARPLQPYSANGCCSTWLRFGLCTKTRRSALLLLFK